MRIAVIGRTSTLLAAARLAVERGHTVPLVWTCGAEAHYGAAASEFAAFAAAIGAQYVEGAGLNTPCGHEVLGGANCDLAVSMNWPRLIGAGTIALFPQGVLNIHAGDLPRYRGNACPNWAILRGEPRIGLCIHQMAAELDAGPVVLREHLALTDATYIGDVYRWIDERAPHLLIRAAEGLVSGRLRPVQQDPAAALRTYPRRAEDGRICWAEERERVLRLVRASSRPFAGAFTTLEGRQKLIVWLASRFASATEHAAVPGQVCFGVDGDPVVAAGDGLLRLEDVELEGAPAGAEAKRLILRSLRHRLV